LRSDVKVIKTFRSLGGLGILETLRITNEWKYGRKVGNNIGMS
jgi:hypothetical protein